MQTRSTSLVLAATFVLATAAACGGGAKTTTPTTTAKPPVTAPKGASTTATPKITPASKLTFKAHLTAANHHPVVNKNWPITVTVTSLSGKPIAATLTLNVVTPGFGTYQVDNGKVYHFVGRHYENITWPGNAVGFALKLQALVTVKGQTAELLWPLTVRNR
jgi:hypothetical protein